MIKKVSFKNSKGKKLIGIISTPKKKTNRIIILCHGFSTSKNNFTNKTLTKLFLKIGIPTFRFDFYGHGESEGKFEDITISEAVDDILKAIKFLKKLGYTKIGLMGSSFGGIASIMVASKTNNLSVLALKSPVSNYKEKGIATKTKKELEEWKKKGFIYYATGDGRKLRLNYTFFKDFEKNNGYKAANKIQIPTLIVHGDKDKSVPIKQSKKIAGLIPDCKLEIIKGADHKYRDKKHFQKMIIFMFDWFKKHLR